MNFGDGIEYQLDQAYKALADARAEVRRLQKVEREWADWACENKDVRDSQAKEIENLRARVEEEAGNYIEMRDKWDEAIKAIRYVLNREQEGYVSFCGLHDARGKLLEVLGENSD